MAVGRQVKRVNGIVERPEAESTKFCILTCNLFGSLGLVYASPFAQQACGGFLKSSSIVIMLLAIQNFFLPPKEFQAHCEVR